MTYQDVLSCPTFERRFLIQLLMNENKRRQDEQEEAMKNVRASRASGKGSKGSRTTTIGGDQLKQKLLSGEIPNE